MRKIYKYKIKVKSFCVRCNCVIDIYEGKQGKVYPVICGSCVKALKKFSKDILESQYWTKTGG